MADQPKKKVWVDPDGQSLAFLKKYKPTKEESVRVKDNHSKNKGGTVLQGEIIESDQSEALMLQQKGLPTFPGAPKMPQPKFSPPLDLSQLERTLRQMVRTLDFQIPEGWLDSWFGRPNHRVMVKTERLALITQFQERALAALINQSHMAEEVRKYNQIRNHQVLEHLIHWRTAAEEYYRLFLVKEQIEYERTIGAVKAQTELAKEEEQFWNHKANTAEHQKRLRDANREPLQLSPPPPIAPPPTPPTAEEKRANDKARIQQEIERLDREEAAEISKMTGGRPEEEWSEEVMEKVRRVQNMYEHAREQKRQELGRFL